MRAVFARGGDLHRENAALMARCPEDQVTDPVRARAKAVSFGTLFGQGSRGLVQTAWNDWRLVLTLEEADHARETFFRRYPRIREWQRANADEARRIGCVRTIKGRPLYAGWELSGLKWTTCCNFPVQGSASDLMLSAMARVVQAIEPYDAHLIMQVHDELVTECAEEVAPEIEQLLTQHMTAAFVELFPDAPVYGLVEVAARQCWAKPKKKVKGDESNDPDKSTAL